MKERPQHKANGNKEVFKIITVYRQAGCEAKEIQTLIACISLIMCGILGQFPPLFYAVFKRQRRIQASEGNKAASQ